MEEANFGGEAHRFYPSSMLRQRNGDGKRSLDWDLNDWKWDSDLFIATPTNSSVQLDCTRSRQLFPLQEEFHVLSNSSSSCSDDIINPVIGNGNGKGKRELEKRRRVVICEDSELNDQPGNLSLNLGDHVYPIAKNDGANCDEKNGKKTKTLTATTSNRAVCQVEGCVSDLSVAKDYHRRHKVCEMHSKASKALVGNVMQRFCQQCSRFHVLQEFDEGKRSCRRRLAGHNRRRRKTHPEATLNGSSLNDDQSSNYLLISLLRILTNMHSNNSEQAKDQDLLSHLLRNLASYDGTIDGRNVSGKVQESKEVVSVEATAGGSSEPWLFSSGHETSGHLGSTSQITKAADSQGPQSRAIYQNMKSASVVSEKGTATNTFLDRVQQTLPFGRKDCHPANAVTSVGGTRLNNFDLNYAYSDSQDYGGLENSQHVNIGSDSPNLPSWMQKDSHQSSPPQTSLNSDSLSSQSPSTSGGDAQSRTDRIVFKLFGKDPNHFPVGLRSQILNWLSHSPTDIESYIRPGCVILTIYLRLADSTWQELQDDLTSSLSRLLAVSDDFFWSTGWVFTRVQHRIAFIYNGQIVLDTALPLTSWNHSRIASVTPIAVSVSERAMFLVKGYNLSRPTARLVCALEGKYLIQEATSDLLGVDALQENNEIQCLSFPCSIPNVTGRGFLEVEDHGLSSGFFPFIVAEQDVCSEIRMLESAVEVSQFSGDNLGSTDKMGTKNQAVDFINEMGWLLRRSCLRSKLGQAVSNSDIFPFTRFRWLLEFSMDRDWCAVVKKLLDVLFHGNVSSGDHSSVELALLEVGLLHRAVRRRCKEMVELLLRYVPHTASGVAGSERNQLDRSGSDFLFRPDAVGPLGLTPLHIAASSDGSENLLDLLTDDPGLVGVTAWKTVHDKSGLTPEDYARLRGHYGYIQLVHKKINSRVDTGHVILDIPSVPMDYDAKLRQTDRLNAAKVKGLQIDRTKMRPIKMPTYCKVCDQQVARGNMHSSLVYRPAMLSMLAIAAVCVCVSLLFKSSPEVVFVNQFRWELLKYGSS